LLAIGEIELMSTTSPVPGLVAASVVSHLYVRDAVLEAAEGRRQLAAHTALVIDVRIRALSMSQSVA
jgi:hypothetical protein